MILDIRSMPDNSDFDCDLCIIGGGAAGITMALEFANTGVDILLLESGSFELEDDTQALYSGENIGLPYFDLEYTRLRYLGGATNHWGGMSRPLDPIDFESRDWVAHSGWPITYNEFAAYLPRAGNICQIPSNNYDALHWMKHQANTTDHNYERDKAGFSSFEEAFVPGVFQFSPPTIFGEVYRSALEKANNIKVLLNANVTSIDTLGNPNKVNQLSVSALSGKRATIHPKQVVLATGGIENARVLLASNKTHTKGLGNENGLVGRFFADHIELRSGFLISQQHSKFFNKFDQFDRPICFALDVAPEMQRTKKIINQCLTFDAISYKPTTADGVQAARKIKRSLDRGKWPDNFFSNVGTAIMDIDDIFSYMRSKNGSKEKGNYSIMYRVEPQPNPNSSVTLSDNKDALGIPKVKLNWQLTELDYRSIYEMQTMFTKLLGKSGYGHINIELPEKFDEWPDTTDGGNHHMGTTRMANSPSTGVVDKNCKIFNIENLYVAGSSVFPTYGKVNPTLNLIALTIRLADHLKEKMEPQA